MATIQQGVYKLINISVANQPRYIYAQLKNLGINNNPFIPSGTELEGDMYKLYASNKGGFYNILRGLTFDATKTDSINSTQVLRDLAIQEGITTANPTAKINWQEIWDKANEIISGKDITITKPNKSTTTSISIPAVISLVIVAILVLVAVYIAFFRKVKLT